MKIKHLVRACAFLALCGIIAFTIFRDNPADQTSIAPPPAPQTVEQASVPEQAGDGQHGAPAIVRFGQIEKLRLEDVPEGRFHDELSSLSPEALTHALEQLASLDVPLADCASLHAFSDGTMYYACEGLTYNGNDEPPAETAELPATAETEAVTGDATTGSIPVTTPPIYHSKPGSANVLYLDFNGMVISKNTLWGQEMKWTRDQECYAYSQDSDFTTFTNSEQGSIYTMWASVAEDYAPFDIDVTTEAPAGMATNNKVAIVLITRSTAVPQSGVSQANPANDAGGVAIMNCFGAANYSSTMRPAFVYCNNLSNDTNAIAYSASHEAGHNFGLSHDGTTDGIEYYEGHYTDYAPKWAPIMGAGFRMDLSQWSKGEYYLANNKQDDLAIIAAKTGWRTDEDSNSTATARSISNTGLEASASGYITKSTDADLFKITTNSHHFLVEVKTANVNSYDIIANLDIKLELLNSSGNIIATNAPTGTIAASLERDCNKNEILYLRVSGTGVESPQGNNTTGYSNYGSLGRYFITIHYDGRPFFLTKPTSAIVSEGGSVTLHASAEGAESYQWYHNGSILENTGPTLSLSDFGKSEEGFYTVKAINTHGSSSSTAFLRHDPPGEDYVLYACGANNNGQIGQGDTKAYPRAMRVANNVAEVTTNRDNGLLYITKDNDLYMTGKISSDGISVSGSSEDVITTPLLIQSDIARVTGCHGCTAYITCDGTLYVAGNSIFSKRGINGAVKIREQVISVETYEDCVIYQTADGIVHAFDTGHYQGHKIGIVPDDYVVSVTTGETQIKPEYQTRLADTAAGFAVSKTLSAYWTSDGSIFCSGQSGYGLVGDTNSNILTFVQIADNVTKAFLSDSNLLWIDNNGNLYGRGNNRYGQLGLSSKNSVTAPILVATNIAKVYSSNTNTLYINTDGTLYRIGSGADSCHLGGNTLDSVEPVECARNVHAACIASSIAAYLTIGEEMYSGIRINTYPYMGIRSSGERITLSVDAQCTSPLSYQWYKDGRELVGCTENLIIIDNATVSDTGNYYVSINGTAGERINVFTQLAIRDESNPGVLYGTGDNRYNQLTSQPASTLSNLSLVANNTLQASAGNSWATYISNNGDLFITGTYFKKIDGHDRQEGQNQIQIAEDVLQFERCDDTIVFLKSNGDLFVMTFSYNYSINKHVISTEKIASGIASMGLSNHTNIITRDGELMLYKFSNSTEPLYPISRNAIEANIFDLYMFVNTIDGKLLAYKSSNTNTSLFNFDFNNITGPVEIESNVAQIFMGYYLFSYITRDNKLMSLRDLNEGNGRSYSMTDRILISTSVKSALLTDSAFVFLKYDHTLWALGTGLNCYRPSSNPSVPRLIASGIRSFSLHTKSFLVVADPLTSDAGDSVFSISMRHYMPENTPEVQMGQYADPDGDGRDNITEYSQGTNPFAYDLPEFELRLGTASYESFEIIFPFVHDDLLVATVWTSNDLTNWTPTYITTIESPGYYYFKRIQRSSTNIDGSRTIHLWPYIGKNIYLKVTYSYAEQRAAE